MRTLFLGLLLALLVGGCTGGDSPELKTPTPGPTPTRGDPTDVDRSYARAVCAAFNTYIGALNRETQRDPQLFSDQAKLLRLAAPILETFGKDLDKAKPPRDVSNFHTALVERVKAIAKKAKAGQLVSSQELASFTEGAPLPPVTVRGRLADASRNDPQCAQSGGMDALFGAPETQ